MRVGREGKGGEWKGVERGRGMGEGEREERGGERINTRKTEQEERAHTTTHDSFEAASL